MKDMNNAINHNSSQQKPIKKGGSAIHTHRMSICKLSIKKWSRDSASGTHKYNW